MEIENVVNCALSVQINDSGGLSTMSNLYFKKDFKLLPVTPKSTLLVLSPNHHTYMSN